MNEKLSIRWGYPTHLFRAFDKEEYATSFVKFGQFRLTHIRKYAVCTEQNIRDDEEGMYSWGCSGGLSGGRRCSPYAVYIFCLAGPDISWERLKNYGTYVVRINDPETFARDIASRFRGGYRVDCVKVMYRDLIVTGGERPDPKDFTFTYSEKPSSFSEDDEYRVAAIADQTGGGYIGCSIDIGKSLPYAEILQP